jgi:hypothetical protein
MLNDSVAEVPFVLRVIETRFKLFIDSNGGVLGKRLSKNVLSFNVRNETLVAGNVLCLDVLGGTTDPVFTFLGGVGELYTIIVKVLRGLLRVQGPLGMLNLASSGHQGGLGVLLHFFRLINDDAVSLSGGAGKNLHLLGDVASVTGEVLFLVIYLSCHFSIKIAITAFLNLFYFNV